MTIYTTERTADNGEIIKARLTQTANGYLIEILANGMAIINETFEVTRDEKAARGMAHIAATAYVFKLNNPNYGVIEESTDVLSAIETMIADIATESPRIRQLREKIERNERELESLRFELAQALEGESEPVALNAWQVETLKKAAGYRVIAISRNVLIDATNSHEELVWFMDLQDKGYLCPDDDYKRHYNITVKGWVYLSTQE